MKNIIDILYIQSTRIKITNKNKYFPVEVGQENKDDRFN